MAQQEVIKCLKKEKKAMSRTEIANNLKKSPIIVSKALNCLFENGEVKAIEINSEQAIRLYGSKRKMRLYYV